MNLNLLLAYEVDGRAVSLARVRNRGLLKAVAAEAIVEKRAEVNIASRIDPGLGVIAESELESLSRVLSRMGLGVA
jgi:hypothetical protein